MKGISSYDPKYYLKISQSQENNNINAYYI